MNKVKLMSYIGGHQIIFYFAHQPTLAYFPQPI